MSKLNLVEALKNKGAELDSRQIVFVNGLEDSIGDAIEKANDNIQALVSEQLGKIDLPEEHKETLREVSARLDKIESQQPYKLVDIEKYFLKAKVKEKHSEIVEAVKNKKSFNFSKLFLGEIKMQDPHENLNGTIQWGVGNHAFVENVEIDSTIYPIRVPEGFIYQLIRNVQRPWGKVAYNYFWTEQSGEVGVFAVTAEGDEKPQKQYLFTRNSISREKIAGRIEWSEEFEMDNEALFGAIVRMVERDILREWHNYGLSSMLNNATPYVANAWSGTIAIPNFADVGIVLSAVIKQRNYDANAIVINTVDYINFLLLKDRMGQYFSNPYFKDGKLLGMNVIVTNLMWQGFILVLDSSIYDEEHTGVQMRVGQYDDQFVNNMWTLIAEMFSLFKTRVVDRPGSILGDIDVIIADLEDPTAILCCEPTVDPLV